MYARDFHADEPEWMDAPDMPRAELHEQLRRLAQINRYFGGTAALLRVFLRLKRDLPDLHQANIIDVCTGYADLPRQLLRRHRGSGSQSKIFAVDRHATTLHLAREATDRRLPIYFVQADAMRLPFKDRSAEIVLCSLALHHFSDEDAGTVLREIQRIARRGAAVIDLVRGRLAYAAVWGLTQIWMRDPATRHDGRVSVQRAFTPAEMKSLAERAGWVKFQPMKLPWFRQAIAFVRPHAHH